MRMSLSHLRFIQQSLSKAIIRPPPPLVSTFYPSSGSSAKNTTIQTHYNNRIISRRNLSSTSNKSVADIPKDNQEPVLYEEGTNHVRFITLNRPNKRNAMNKDMVLSLKNYLRIFNDDKDAKVAILSGRGGNFCSGYDLNELVDIEDGQAKVGNLNNMLLPMDGKLSRNKIVIAAIEGYAVGVGFELVLKCDMRIAENDAVMGFFNRRFNIPIVNGGTILLPKLINGSTAIDLIITGRSVQAVEALQIGLIKQRCDIGCCLGTATNLARSLIKFDQETLLNDKNSTYHSIMQIQDVDNKLMQYLLSERLKGLNQFSNSLPLTTAVKFLKGQACRHGKFNLQNKVELQPECTV